MHREKLSMENVVKYLRRQLLQVKAKYGYGQIEDRQTVSQSVSMGPACKDGLTAASCDDRLDLKIPDSFYQSRGHSGTKTFYLPDVQIRACHLMGL